MRSADWPSSLLNHHQLLILWISLLLYLVFSGAYGAGAQRQKTYSISFSRFILLQLASLSAFIAFGAIIGQFPFLLIGVSLSIATLGWLVQIALVHRALPSFEQITPVDEAETDSSTSLKDQEQATIILSSGVTPGLINLAVMLIIFGVQIYCYVSALSSINLHPPVPSRYEARMALLMLIIPSAVQMLGIYLMLFRLLRSPYTQPELRNKVAAMALFALWNGSVLIFVPATLYGKQFQASGLEIAGFAAGVICLVLVTIPYLLGIHRRRVTKQRLLTHEVESRDRILAVLAWPDGAYKTAQFAKARREMLGEHKRLWNGVPLRFRLTRTNPVLALASVLMVERFVESAGTLRAARLALLKEAGFEPDALNDFEHGDRLERSRQQLAGNPAVRALTAEAGSNWEKDPTGLFAAHLLMSYVAQLTELASIAEANEPDARFRIGDLFVAEARREDEHSALPIAVQSSIILGSVYEHLYGDATAGYVSNLVKLVFHLP